MKKIIKSWTTGPTHNGWLIETADGNFEVWMEGISFHPSKSREYPEVLVETISGDEVARRDQETLKKGLEVAAVEKAAKKKKEGRQDWIATLPNTIVDGSETLTVDKIQGGICDSHGNFLFPLPSAPVPDFRVWVLSTMNDFLGGGE